MAKPLEDSAAPLEVLWHRPLRSEMPLFWRPQADELDTKIFKLRWVLGPSDQNELTTLHYYPKYEVWATEKCLWDGPFKIIFTHSHPLLTTLLDFKISPRMIRNFISLDIQIERRFDGLP